MRVSIDKNYLSISKCSLFLMVVGWPLTTRFVLSLLHSENRAACEDEKLQFLELRKVLTICVQVLLSSITS